MKRMIYAVAALSLLAASGCATKGYVKSETDPLADRLGRLEGKVNALEARPVGMTGSERATMQDALDTARKALDTANRAESEAKDAQAAAQRAEQSTAEAEKAAKKTEKIFKLEQKK